MTTYARIVNGVALDCRVQASASELVACFHPDWLTAHPFVVVPDGTLHGAKDNGNGTFTNPPPPAPITVDSTLDRRTLRSHVVTVLGGAGSGSAKLQNYIDTANTNTATTQTAQNMRLALDTYRNENLFTKTDAQQLMSALQFASGDSAAVLAAWPFVQVS